MNAKMDLSMLKMMTPAHDVNMRKNPADMNVPAGNKQAPDAYLSFFDNEPQLAETDPTDPITHFRHAGLDKPVLYHKARKANLTTRCAAQTWTYSRDPALLAELENEHSRAALSQKMCIEPSGMLRYRIAGGEDLLPGGTRKHVKCDLPVPPGTLAANDKLRLAYCVREASRERAPVPNHNTQSKRIWDIMYDKKYIKEQRSESSPRTLQADQLALSREMRDMPAAGVRAIVESLDPEPASDDEQLIGNRDPRDGPCPYQLGPRKRHRDRMARGLESRSLPPRSNRCHSEKSTNNRLSDRGQHPLSVTSSTSRGYGASEASSRAPPSAKHQGQDVAQQQTLSRPSTAPGSRQSYVPSVQPWNSAPARETPTRSMTSRGSSSCMSPVSISNALVANQRGSMTRSKSASARSSTRSMQRSASR